MKVKSESEVAQSCPTLSDPMDCSLPGSSVHGIFRQEYWSGGSRVVVQMEEVTRTVNMVMVLVPPVLLLLCILGLTYALVQMQRKGAPRMLLYCKRSLQEWV